MQCLGPSPIFFVFELLMLRRTPTSSTQGATSAAPKTELLPLI